MLPPMMCSAFNFLQNSGSILNASATLVSGPNAINVNSPECYMMERIMSPLGTEDILRYLTSFFSGHALWLKLQLVFPKKFICNM